MRNAFVLLASLMVACSSADDARSPGTGDGSKTNTSADGGDGSSASNPSSPSDGGGGDAGVAGDAAAPGARWTPTQSDRFLYQLGDPQPATTACVAPSTGGACVKPTVWVFDLYAADATTPNAAGVAAVHAVGGHAVYYVSGGSFEKGRPDVAAFPANVLGKVLDGWPDERWLDVRELATLTPIMRARAAKCHDAGFDAIEWDNVDGYANDNGFGFGAAAQLAYNRLLADIAHDAGLSVALKNDLDQIADLVTSFDFAINEQCAQYDECAALDPFTSAGKAVVQIEYEVAPSAFCAAANAAHRSAARMALALKPSPWTPCR